jgi:hypothetical protein
MKQLFVGVVVMLAACWSSNPPPAQEPTPSQGAKPAPAPATRTARPSAADTAPASFSERAITKMAGYRDALCNCADRLCANRVVEDMTKWGEEMAHDPNRTTKMNEADTQRAAEISETMGKCLSRLAAQPTPSP